MALSFTTLGSGSSGNASLIEVEGFSLLLDCGLGPRQLASRLAQVGTPWQRIRAVLLTHIHGDHWNDRAFRQFLKLKIPLYCHAGHQENLARQCISFSSLLQAKLVRHYEADRPLQLAPSLRARPLALRHDSGPTFGFRFEGPPDALGNPLTIGYAADLGCWDADLVDALADVDLLALEFNHDIALERLSGRSQHLIARVLGDEGHLSNCQAAELLREMQNRVAEFKLRHLVQLHLSRDCNRPELARTAARKMVGEHVDIHVAAQGEPGPTLRLSRNGVARPVAMVQPCLPGMEE